MRPRSLEELAIFQEFDDAAAMEEIEIDLLYLGGVDAEVDDPSARAGDPATERPRYAMHEMLRQFADAQVAQRPRRRTA